MADSRKKDPCRITLKNVRLSYPNIFTPRAFGRGEGKPAFSASALIPKDTKHGKALIDMIYDAIDAAKEKKWPGKDVKIKKANIAFADGDIVNEDEDDPKPEQEGMMIVRARNYKRPMVLDENNDELREQDNIIYGGCYVDMIVTFWGQDYEGTKRMNCSLEGIRYRDEGEAFGAGPINPDEFDDGPDDKDAGRSRSRSRDDDDDDRGSRRGRGRDKDDDDDGDRRSSRRGRDKDDDDDDRGSSRRRSRDDDDDDKDDRRSSRRGRDDDEDEDRGSRRRGRDKDDDDDKDDRRSSRRSRDDDEDDDRSSRRGRGRDNDDDDDRRSSRRSRDDDDDRDNRSSRRGRDKDDDEDDRGSRRRGRRDDLA